ncbi:hypothetical protein CRUP_001564, partial [Coryphaenoides rupestris]
SAVTVGSVCDCDPRPLGPQSPAQAPTTTCQVPSSRCAGQSGGWQLGASGATWPVFVLRPRPPARAVNVAGVGPFSEAVFCQTPCSAPAAVAHVYALKEAEMRAYEASERTRKDAHHHDDDGEEEEEDDDDEEEEEEEEEEAVSSSRVRRYSPSTCLGVRWEPPCDHGSPITSYLIDLGERQPLAVGPVTHHILQNLQPDTSYRIRVQALNSLGAGPFSHAFKLKTKPLPPAPPRLECTAFSHQTLRLKLNESTSYTFRIQAFNEAGQGPFSNVYTFTTPRSPPAPV